MAYCQAKLKSNGDKAYSKHVRQMFAYLESAVGIIQTHSY